MLNRVFGVLAGLSLIFVAESNRTNAQEKAAEVAQNDPSIAKWEKEIAALEELDSTEKAGKDSILFLGSSSIRLWKSMADDLAPWPVVRRGYGGAKFSDLAFYIKRLMMAHSPRAVVIYVGNDITGKPETDKTPEDVLKLYERVISDIRLKAAEAEIFVIGITPSPKRFVAWEQLQKLNALLEARCEKDERLHFIRTAEQYLTTDGRPRPELYVSDQLHQNADGYKLWSGIIKAELEKILGAPTTNTSR
jgi:hypothetical protein